MDRREGRKACRRQESSQVREKRNCETELELLILGPMKSPATAYTAKANPIINYSNYFQIIYTILHAVIMLHMKIATSLMQ